ncbi:MAG: helix-hairpin-helix domain-containing protein [Geopsychrobacter sp.]|nr:helix-hairpin-helix domain-containing protein [Geopsychrobacter sp.]
MLVRGGWFLLLLIIGVSGFDMSRLYLRSEDGSALVFSVKDSTLVEFRGIGPRFDGIHQLNDARRFLAVIKMANGGLADSAAFTRLRNGPVKSGECFVFQLVEGNIVAVESVWMSAAKRMVLGIPLMVDSMNREDWSDLPGVGASLALRIEAGRQKNGEFGQFSDLSRVKGIGRKSLQRWEHFFNKQK